MGIAVNMIPHVVAASPGLKRMAVDLPDPAALMGESVRVECEVSYEEGEQGNVGSSRTGPAHPFERAPSLPEDTRQVP